MGFFDSGAFDGLVGSVGGSLASGLFNSNEASKNRAFQERMSSTSHQRDVKDLRAAGLNPVLSAMGGSGASTPGGAQGSMPDIGSNISGAMMAGLAKKKLQAEIRNINSNTQANTMAAEKAWEESKNTAIIRRLNVTKLPQAENMKKMNETIYGKKYRPFLSDILNSIGALK